MMKVLKILLAILVTAFVLNNINTSEYVFCDNKQCVWCYETVDGVRQQTAHPYFSEHP